MDTKIILGRENNSLYLRIYEIWMVLSKQFAQEVLTRRVTFLIEASRSWEAVDFREKPQLRN